MFTRARVFCNRSDANMTRAIPVEKRVAVRGGSQPEIPTKARDLFLELEDALLCV